MVFCSRKAKKNKASDVCTLNKEYRSEVGELCVKWKNGLNED